MSIRRSHSSVALSLLLLASVVAAAADDAAAQRARIDRERAAVEAQARAGERECTQRFAVSSCLAGVRAERRAALEQLDRQDVLLADAQRKRRAAERQARVEQRQRAQAREDEQREPPKPAKPPKPSRPENETRVPALPDDDAAAVPARRPSAGVAREAAQAQRRAEASGRRAREAQAHREAVERRNQERAARKPPAPSLPVPTNPAP
jgi:colicin import membrane protein